jgi:hypothetical protein
MTRRDDRSDQPLVEISAWAPSGRAPATSVVERLERRGLVERVHLGFQPSSGVAR